MALERVLVVGASGLVGNALLRAWAARGTEVFSTTYEWPSSPLFRRLDMRDAAAVRGILEEFSPGLVALPAANPHVDYCQTHPGETRLVNVAGSLNVARACRERGVRMIFFSSDYVFDGRKGRYVEDDQPSPINEYGRQKAEVEAAVLSLDPRNLVIRTSAVYGWQWDPKNFALQVVSRLRAGEPMRVVSDVRYNPTYAENLAEAVAGLAQAGLGGIFHAVGSQTLARDEFARRIADAFGLEARLIEPALSSEFASPTPRPKESSLATEKLRSAIGTPLWGVSEGLSHMVAFEPGWRDYARGLPSPPGRSPA